MGFKDDLKTDVDAVLVADEASVEAEYKADKYDAEWTDITLLVATSGTSFYMQGNDLEGVTDRIKVSVASSGSNAMTSFREEETLFRFNGTDVYTLETVDASYLGGFHTFTCRLVDAHWRTNRSNGIRQRGMSQ